MTAAIGQNIAPSQLTQVLEQEIRSRTWGRIRRLRVERCDGQIIVHGESPSYYLTQLALQAVLGFLPDKPRPAVTLNISVCAESPSRD